MPDRNDLHLVVSDPVEEAIRIDDHLAVRQVRELGDDTTRLREVTQLGKSVDRARQNSVSCSGTVLADQVERIEKLATR